MPLIYRAMQGDSDGPLLGHIANDTLGVRDVDILSVGDRVLPQTGGMSVSPAKEQLPPHLIPKKHRRLGGRRSNAKPETYPWRIGAGDFADGPLCDRLVLRLDPNNSAHGLVEPGQEMPLTEYRDAIEATRAGWVQEQW
jgi:hypothetical protein